MQAGEQGFKEQRLVRLCSNRYSQFESRLTFLRSRQRSDFHSALSFQTFPSSYRHFATGYRDLHQRRSTDLNDCPLVLRNAICKNTEAIFLFYHRGATPVVAISMGAKVRAVKFPASPAFLARSGGQELLIQVKP